MPTLPLAHMRVLWVGIWLYARRGGGGREASGGASHPADEVCMQGHLGDGEPCQLQQRPHLGGDVLLLIRCEEVGHFARVQQAVQVLQERLHADLRVREEEGGVLRVQAGEEKHALQVLPPVVKASHLGVLDGEYVLLLDVDGELGEALTAASAGAQQQRVAKREADDTADAADVLNGIHKHGQLHGRPRRAVVVVQHLAHHPHHRHRVRHLHVPVTVPPAPPYHALSGHPSLDTGYWKELDYTGQHLHSIRCTLCGSHEGRGCPPAVEGVQEVGEDEVLGGDDVVVLQLAVHVQLLVQPILAQPITSVDSSRRNGS
eukprot:1196258-Prorocentrum_minimum.AAC.6